MIFEVICPDCRGRGHFSIVEGDIFKGYSLCARCNGHQVADIEIDEDEIHDIIFKLIEDEHSLVNKYL